MTKILPYTFGVEIECFGVPIPVVTWALGKAGVSVADLCSPRPANGTALDVYNQAASGRYGETTWVISGDGSIRGNYPMEIKSPILKGPEGLKTLRKVVGILRHVGLKVNESTGLHVHVGVKNAPGEHSHNVRTVLEILKRYESFTADIDSLVRADRRGTANTYCRPVKARRVQLEGILGNVEDAVEPLPDGYNDWSSVRREEYRRYGFGDFYWESDNRQHLIAEPLSARRRAGLTAVTPTMDNVHQYGHHYDACSIASLGKYGTIEFRQHQGSMDPTEIVNWVLFVVNHVEQARLAVTKQGQTKTRGRKPGLFTGLPMHVRTHFKKQIAKFGPQPPRAVVPRGGQPTQGLPPAV